MLWDVAGAGQVGWDAAGGDGLRGVGRMLGKGSGGWGGRAGGEVRGG